MHGKRGGNFLLGCKNDVHEFVDPFSENSSMNLT